MTPLLFLASILCVYAVSLMVAKTSGPARIFFRLRNAPKHGTSAREGLHCPICVGTQVAILLTAWLWWIGLVPANESPVWALAFAGGSSLLHLKDGF